MYLVISFGFEKILSLRKEYNVLIGTQASMYSLDMVSHCTFSIYGRLQEQSYFFFIFVLRVLTVELHSNIKFFFDI